MLQENLAALSFAHLSALGLDPSDRPSYFSHADTIKNCLIDGVVGMNILECTTNVIELSFSKSDYLASVLTELHFGKIRIEEQCKNLATLVSSDAQPAWILVTAYYGCYFMANDLAKASGQFIMNISESEFYSIIAAEPPSIKSTMKIDGNTPFLVTVSHGEMSGEVHLSLRKNGTKPHKLVWHNLARLLQKISITDTRVKHLELLKSISLASEGWGNPSDVRNKWNYAHSNYYGDKGRDLARTFLSVIRKNGSAFSWAGNNTLKPTEENIVASIAYLYHVLHAAHEELTKRLLI